MNHIHHLFFSITTFCTVISSTNLVSAQIVPDNTLPNNSQIKVEGNMTKIEGGTTAGSNLFHSFEKFGISTGNEAHFNNAVDINNIITRVTGKSISDIDGLIKANGTANLFLINPNGIVFGENARLDIGGSFVGSTADSFQFGDGLEFSAVNPDSKPLLSINVPLGLQYGKNSGNILVKGDRQGVRNSSEVIDTQTGLRVKPDKTLALIGGDINLEGATLKTGGGRIELGSVAAEGLVNLTAVEKGFSFDYDNVVGGNIDLSEQTAVDASGNGAGDIRVWGRKIKITNGSVIETSTLGSENGESLVVNAQESVEIIGTNDSQFTGLFAQVYSEATGNGGDLIVETNNFLVKDGAQVDASTFGKGKGGNLTIDATDIQIIGTSKDSQFISGLFASSQPNSTGDAGNLTITTNSLLVKDGAQVISSTFGKGKGGNLTIDADDIQLIGTSKDGQFRSVLSASARLNSKGDSGDLTIKTNNLLVKDGAQVGAATLGEGKGGNLIVDADDIQLIGTSKDNQFISGLFASAEPNSTGDAGSITIKTNSLLVKDGAKIIVSTFGKGKGGNLTIDATDIQLIGTSQDNQIISGLGASSEVNSTGDAGNLTIKTNRLLVKDGAQVGASTFGEGKGGNLTVDAQDIQLIGTTKDGQFSSGLFASTERNLTGNAGELTIKTNLLLVKDGARVSTSTVGEAKGGNLNVNARDIQLIGTSEDGSYISGLFASADSNSTGDAGELTIKTNTLLVKDGAGIIVQNLGKGRAGNLIIDADSIRLNNNALLSANTRNNKIDSDTEQATINIKSQELIMRRGSKIFTNATGENVVGGNINIDTDLLVASENSDISANSENFRGGNVRIDAQGVFGTQFRSQPTPQSDITATGATENLSGNVEVITPRTDINSGLVELPTITVETEIADACSTPGYAQSSFTITGKGSLPPSPFEPLTGRLNRTKLATLDEVGEIKSQGRRRQARKAPQRKQIVEAKGWVRTKNGEIILVAYSPQDKFSSPLNTPRGCKPQANS